MGLPARRCEAIFASKAGTASRPSAAHVKTASWKFVVSGDSRNCGDVVMPAIAAAVKKNGAHFYWHLGDLRKITGVDEDIEHQPEYIASPLTIPEYEAMAWPDFIHSQIEPFGKVSFFLGIGNHETVLPKTRAAFTAQFSSWLDEPVCAHSACVTIPPLANPKPITIGSMRGSGFHISRQCFWKTNSTPCSWHGLKRRCTPRRLTVLIRTIVMGMRTKRCSKASPKIKQHGGVRNGYASGRRVYADLLEAQNGAHKLVYVLASHSHFFMDGIFNTDYWRTHGGILPGWIIGTAGAQRYALPKESVNARARPRLTSTDFRMGTASPGGRIDFSFQRFSEQGHSRCCCGASYTPEFVHWCFRGKFRSALNTAIFGR